MKKPISQNEARRLRKRVTELMQEQHDRITRWNDDYPGGVNIAQILIGPSDERIRGKLDAVTILDKVLVAKWRQDRNTLDVFAVEH